MKCGLLEGEEDNEHFGVGFVEMSKMFATLDRFFVGAEVLDRVQQSQPWQQGWPLQLPPLTSDPASRHVLLSHFTGHTSLPPTDLALHSRCLFHFVGFILFVCGWSYGIVVDEMSPI